MSITDRSRCQRSVVTFGRRSSPFGIGTSRARCGTAEGSLASHPRARCHPHRSRAPQLQRLFRRSSLGTALTSPGYDVAPPGLPLAGAGVVMPSHAYRDAAGQHDEAYNDKEEQRLLSVEVLLLRDGPRHDGSVVPYNRDSPAFAVTTTTRAWLPCLSLRCIRRHPDRGLTGRFSRWVAGDTGRGMGGADLNGSVAHGRDCCARCWDTMTW